MVLMLFCCGGVLFAQEEKKTTGSGKPIITVFSNFHSGFGATNDDRGFELDRSYLGYQYTLPGNIELKAVMDIGQSDAVHDYHRIAYIKNAQVTWRSGRLTLAGGLISTIQFGVQEKGWGGRYILKSFQDLYKFGSSADLGVSASYRFADWLTADAIIVNGEGYKKIQKTDGLLYGLGATLTPVKGLTLRLYGSLNEVGEGGGSHVGNLAFYAGYKIENISLGAEYNLMTNYKHVEGNDRYGLSFYCWSRLSQRVDLFARYDHLSSRSDWDITSDGEAALLGVQVKLGKYISVAPNLRLWAPAVEGADLQYSGYLSCRFAL